MRFNFHVTAPTWKGKTGTIRAKKRIVVAGFQYEMAAVQYMDVLKEQHKDHVKWNPIEVVDNRRQA